MDLPARLRRLPEPVASVAYGAVLGIGLVVGVLVWAWERWRHGPWIDGEREPV